MSKRSALLAGGLSLGALLVPALGHADVRIQEQSTTLDSTIHRWTFIKGDRRSVVTRAETTGTLYNAGARYGAYVEIARPDKEVIWELDPQERSYREVTQAQFTKLLQKGIQAPRTANEQPLRSLYQSETTAIEVVPTGQTKKIAGFEAEQVMARVVVGAQNLISGNQFRFTFDQEIWITKDERLLKEVQTFEEAYIEKFGSAASLSQARVVAGEWSDTFITHLRAVNDRVRALHGFPLASTTTVTEEALAANKGEKGTSRKFTAATIEVKQISMESVPDSEFELPGGYINSDTNVATAAPAGPTRVAAAPPIPTPMAVASANPPAAKVDAPGARADGPGKAASAVVKADPGTGARPTVAGVPDKEPAAVGLVASAGKASGTGASVAAAPQVAPKPGSGTTPTAVAGSPVPPASEAGAYPFIPAVPNVGLTNRRNSPSSTGISRPSQAFVDGGRNGEQGAGPSIVSSTVLRTSAPPPPVTIDEPEEYLGKKKKRH